MIGNTIVFINIVSEQLMANLVPKLVSESSNNLFIPRKQNKKDAITAISNSIIYLNTIFLVPSCLSVCPVYIILIISLLFF